MLERSREQGGLKKMTLYGLALEVTDNLEKCTGFDIQYSNYLDSDNIDEWVLIRVEYLDFHDSDVLLIGGYGNATHLLSVNQGLKFNEIYTFVHSIPFLQKALRIRTLSKEDLK